MKHLRIYLLLILSLAILPEIIQAQTQMGMDINGISLKSQFGSSVSMNADGNIAVVGARHYTDNWVRIGRVSVYSWNGTSWQQMGDDIYGLESWDELGTSVSISDDGYTIALGAPAPSHSQNGIGVVMIYHWNNVAWVPKGEFIYAVSPYKLSGTSVSLSADGNRVTIGEPAGPSFSDSGTVRVYEYAGPSLEWEQLGADIEGEQGLDHAGSSVSMSGNGNTIVIGAKDNDGHGERAGHIRIYDYVLQGVVGTWVQRGNDIDGDVAGHSFGYYTDIDADGNTVVAGVNYFSANYPIGRVRVFKWNGSAWQQMGSPVAGKSVSINDAGNTIITGNSVIPDGGVSKIYNWNAEESAWKQRGVDIEGDTGSHSGSSVSMSGDGRRVIIGSPRPLHDYDEVGHVKIYDICPGTAIDVVSIYSSSYGWIDGNTYFSNNNTATHTLTNVLGCDSVITLNLTFVRTGTPVKGTQPPVGHGMDRIGFATTDSSLDEAKIYSYEKTIVIDLSHASIKGMTDVSIYNTMGQLLSTSNIEERSVEEYQGSKLPAGYYLVRLSNGRESTVQKVFIRE